MGFSLKSAVGGAIGGGGLFGPMGASFGGLMGGTGLGKGFFKGQEGQFTGSPEWQQAAYRQALEQGQASAKTPGMGIETARGEFLRPETNPFLQSTIEAAQRPVTERFREVTTPGIEATYAKAGRLGSGGLMDARERAQRQLARELGDVSSRMAGEQYGRERGLQTAMQTQLDPLERARILASMSGNLGATTQERQSSPFEKLVGGATGIGGLFGGGLLGLANIQKSGLQNQQLQLQNQRMQQVR